LVKRVAKKTDTTISNLTAPIYIFSVAALYFGYFILYFGLYSIDTEYIRYLSIFIHILICMFLLIRFNPFRTEIQYKPYDSMIIFSSAILLLTNVIATEVGLGTFTSINTTAKSLNNTFSYITPNQIPTSSPTIISWWNYLFPSSKNQVITPSIEPTKTQQQKQQNQKQKQIQNQNQSTISYSI